MVSTFKEANPESTMKEFLPLSLLKNGNSSDSEEIEIDSMLKNKENAGVMKKQRLAHQVRFMWRCLHCGPSL